MVNSPICHSKTNPQFRSSRILISNLGGLIAESRSRGLFRKHFGTRPTHWVGALSCPDTRLVDLGLHASHASFLAPTEGRSDRSQNRLHDMHIVGNAQLIWDG